MDRIKWEEYFMAQSHLLALRSTCERLSVGATIYVTHFPCLNCTKSIIQSGIDTIYYAEDYHNHTYALELLKQAGIEYKKISFDQEHVAQYLLNK